MAEHRAFGPQDDDLHRAELGDRWWATETAWFSFHDPARRLGGWLYTMIRPNIGTVAGGVWVWDDTAWLPWDVLYSTNYSALQLPAGHRPARHHAADRRVDPRARADDVLRPRLRRRRPPATSTFASTA